jgi:gamma-glutamyltranspeptidase/glutathione hydrolase
MRAARRRLYLLPLALCLALLGACARTLWHGFGHVAVVPARPYFDHYAVATENAVASRVGIEALRAGGNAVDAAISIAFTLGVVEPSSSGIGGGGFALVWDAARRKVTALDFREVAPGGVDPAELEYRPKEPVQSGRGRMIGVPGEVAGLAELHRRFGKRSFAENIAPAVAIAEEGYATSAHLASIAVAYHAQLNFSNPLKAIFKPNGYAVGVGRRVVNRNLAATLRRIGAEGPKAFYEGEVASEIVKAAQATGSTLSQRDLRAYRPIEREPLKVAWEGNTVYTMPPPSAGGLLLAETLGMVGKADLEPLGFGTGAYNHLLAETFRGAIVDRMRAIGDPGFVKTDVSALVSKGRLQDRRAQIARDRTRAMTKFPLREHGTAHFAVVDARGNVVSLTTTINDAFGSFVGTETTGIILNDELDDFTTKAASAMFASSAARSVDEPANASKVPASSTDSAGPNEPRPFARPTSSMTPTLAFRDGQPVLAVGGSGGLRIATGVTQALLARMVFGLPVFDCVAEPRVHTPTDETSPVIEIDANVPDSVVQDMKSRGETVKLGPNYSAVQMIALDRGPGGSMRISAASDPRKGGVALVE